MFFLDTWEQVYQKYLTQPEYHKHGLLSKTTMRCYRPKYILLSGSTPLSQCLCDYCENCNLLRRALVAVGIQGIPSNKYTVLDSTMCDIHHGQFGTGYQFSLAKCIMCNCNDCGKMKLGEVLKTLNEDLLKSSKILTWHRWQLVQGRSATQKCLIKGTLKAAVNEFLDIVEDISDHLFRANWNCNMFQFIKNNLQNGYILQVMDFAMNFNNWYQDEV